MKSLQIRTIYFSYKRTDQQKWEYRKFRDLLIVGKIDVLLIRRPVNYPYEVQIYKSEILDNLNKGVPDRIVTASNNVTTLTLVTSELVLKIIKSLESEYKLVWG